MSSTGQSPDVSRHPDAAALTQHVADRLLGLLVEVQAAGRTPAVALTGGTIAIDLYRTVLVSPRCRDVDWSNVDVWWGDERFVPAGDPQRNSGQAREALLDQVPLDPARVHEMAPSDGQYGDDVDAAAAGYAEELRTATPLDGSGPIFDLLLLGIGEDGHCASLMPGSPELHDTRPVVPVRNSPKPPPTRISLTMGPLMRGRELWWIASGANKAEPVRAAIEGADVDKVPAAGPKGAERTIWFVDDAAAAAL
jgi:6-phosphogluconolactonase